MFNWFFNYWYPENPDYIDPDSPEQTIKYVFLEKIKHIEENVGRNTNKTYQNKSQYYNLLREFRRVNTSINNLHKYIQNLENRIETIETIFKNSIVLEPLPLESSSHINC